MNIYVGNMSYDMMDEDLKELFEPFGEVVKATIIIDRDSGRSKGFGFVELGAGADGATAISELDGKEYQGRNLKVNEARPREERPKKDNW